MSIQEILTQVKSGALSLSAAEALIRENPAERSYEEMGFAKLDTDRKKRSGFAEVIYCQGKSDEFIGQIFRRLYEVEGEVFGTRASPHQYEIVKEFLPEISYDPVAEAPFFRYTDEGGAVHEVWFEDARSVDASLSLLREFALTGAGYWNIMRWFPQNWLVLNQRFRILKTF